ncbi:addiction module toxin RelE [Candidatus Woesearchaeota archaeon CG10_big_fil_rev_8_21_14_0_10_32_9]|nr:MAG: addiction module toxin RelE [Candidatus Woesearchaeota archaeon CG10_big_fil_rev_8_21_14_0_10_32_9]
MQEEDLAFEIIFDEDAIKCLNKLNKELKSRIFNKIILSKTNPFRYFKRLEERSDFRLRVGNYRVIADIEKRNIFVTKIGLRKEIYK